MTFTLPRSVWSASESIVGEATLTKLEGPEAEVSVVGSNLLRFRFEADGWDYPSAMTTACSGHPIGPGAPVESAILKPGGAFDNDDPEDQAYLNWFRQEGIYLSAGKWRITAVANFFEDSECAGRARLLSIPVTVTVV